MRAAYPGWGRAPRCSCRARWPPRPITITGTATPKAEAGHDVKFAAADLVGWQEAYVMDKGHSRRPFLHAAAMFRHRLQHLRAIPVDPQDAVDAKAVAARFAEFMQADGPVWAAVQAGDSATATRLARARRRPPTSRARRASTRSQVRWRSRSGYDAHAAVDGFSERLREQIDLDALCDELRSVVNGSVQPTHASVWLRASR